MSFILEYEQAGERAGCSDHDHDLIAEHSRRLDRLWRYDQHIANAEWRNRITIASDSRRRESRASDSDASICSRGKCRRYASNTCPSQDVETAAEIDRNSGHEIRLAPGRLRIMRK